MKLVRNLKLSLGVLAVASLAACGGGGGVETGTGTLKLAMTDAPACGYDSVNVTIEKVRVHQSDSANPDNPTGWSEVVLNPARRVDLLDFQNGLLEELGQVALPTGKYTQMRLVLAKNESGGPLANSVVFSGDLSSELALKTPSAQQSGLKTNINIDIAANQTADFVIDFDACKSVVVAGNSGQYLLKPVVSVIPRYLSGVDGSVDLALANGFTNLSLQQGGVVVKATAPYSDSSGNKFGQFLLSPVAPGSYTLVMTAPGRTTAVVTNVVVAADTVTTVSTALNPPASFSGTVTGTATPVTEALMPLVRVLQPLTPVLTGDTFPAVTTIEVAGRFVDSITGGYSYPLVVNAPLVAPYVAGPLVFTEDATAASNYTLNASLTGFVDQLTAMTSLAADATITTNYTFP